jgi:hypothetical protein
MYLTVRCMFGDRSVYTTVNMSFTCIYIYTHTHIFYIIIILSKLGLSVKLLASIQQVPVPNFTGAPAILTEEYSVVFLSIYRKMSL